MKKAEETPEEFAARMNLFLQSECMHKRPEEEALGFCVLIWEPDNTEGAITYASNYPRASILQFMEEFIERNKPARGRGT